MAMVLDFYLNLQSQAVKHKCSTKNNLPPPGIVLCLSWNSIAVIVCWIKEGFEAVLTCYDLCFAWNPPFLPDVV